MANVVIVGAQWGDEGKGKVVDLYSEFADVVVRYGGGANAGHTLVVEGQKLVTHLIPSGVLRGRGKRCVLADGMVIDPRTLLSEIAELKGKGLLSDDRDLIVGRGAHVILPVHRELDRVRELGKAPIGTTRRGIGPAYEAKMARRGVRMSDLLLPARLRTLLELNRFEVEPLLHAYAGSDVQLPSLDEEHADYVAYGEALRKYFADASRFVSLEMKRGQHVLFEGAQGTLLDVDHGTYPFVTSSSTLAGGACTGTGVGPTTVTAVIGITKAYATRVGGGPFPTELTDDLGSRLREAGAEYGATTGRPRRCGWLDLAALRRAVRLSGMAGIAITKLDVLRGLKKIRICVGYTVEGEARDEIPSELEELAVAKPVYEELEGWEADLRDLRGVEDLPAAARRYVQRVEALAGCDAYLISVGPSRAETIFLKNPFR